MEFNSGVGHLFGGLRNSSVLNIHPEIIHIWTAVVDESEEWSLQLIFQFKQLERRIKPEKNQGFNGIRTRDLREITVRCSTNWARKPHIGSEVNLLSSYLPGQWNDVKYIWNTKSTTKN